MRRDLVPNDVFDVRHVAATSSLCSMHTINRYQNTKRNNVPSKQSRRLAKISTNSCAQIIRLSSVRHQYSPHQNDNINKRERSLGSGRRRRTPRAGRIAAGEVHWAGLSNVRNGRVPEVGHWRAAWARGASAGVQDEAAECTSRGASAERLAARGAAARGWGRARSGRGARRPGRRPGRLATYAAAAVAAVAAHTHTDTINLNIHKLMTRFVVPLKDLL